ncbi:MAG TPA: alpha/beta hydrolase [Gemmatimonadaceae bacterium]|nr:alpha/beta hydrolase [Gemmatimonadaceae bacterium]
MLVRVGAIALWAVIPFGALGAQKTKWQPSPGHTQIAIWPGTPPNAQPGPDTEIVTTHTGLVGGKPWKYIQYVSRPTITVYSPRGANTGAAMLVFPGGGYQILAIDLEGTEICDWLTSRGITCVLLKYRVPKTGPSWQPDCRCQINPKPAPAVQDAQRAIGLVRLHAAEWHIDPHKIGVIGFSAGGHLVAAVSNDYQRRFYRPIDAADQQSSRPDFAVAIYPGHLWAPARGKMAFNPDIHVTRNTSPTFLLQAETDSIDNVNQALVYYTALKDANVPVEMHLYTNGGHAFGLRHTKDPITEWPQLVEKWLRTIGILTQ